MNKDVCYHLVGILRFFYAQDSEGESKSSCVHMGGFNILPEEKHLIYMISTSLWLPLEVILLLCHFSG